MLETLLWILIEWRKLDSAFYNLLRKPLAITTDSKYVYEIICSRSTPRENLGIVTLMCYLWTLVSYRVDVLVGWIR